MGGMLGRVAGGVMLAVSIAGCAAAGPASASGGGGLDGVWVGTLVTVKGQCRVSEPSDLTVTDRSITFVPADGVLSLYGTRDPADLGSVHAQWLGTDVNHRRLPMVFEGRLAGDVVTGTYGTPTCRATITLHRPDRSLLQRIRGT